MIGILAFVELLFNRLAELHIIHETQQKVGFQDFAEFFEGLIQRVVFGVGVEPPKSWEAVASFNLMVAIKRNMSSSGVR